ncbi:tail fiber protein [Clostridium sp. YIM B02555]|uniref:phage tail protein n=1 Tax=Clostridium sp. YIM B02555 TaxID=2911968 RepID=UPI001EEE3A78|nr:tail fiber protein [Clostridium sp. YIM B02555]
MNRIDINTNITNVVKKYLTSFSKSLVSRFYNRTEIDKKMANIDARSEIGKELSICTAVTSSNITYNENSFIQFDKVILNINNDIQTSNDKTLFTLKANKTYEVSGKIMLLATSVSGFLTTFLYNYTDNINIAGISSVSTNFNSNQTNESNFVRIIKVDNKDIQIGIKMSSGIPGVIIQPRMTSINIKEIGRTVVIDPAQQIDKTTGIQDTPLGHIMPFVGINAPAHYLICDGSTYNITDKRDLANYFLTEFGSINYFGGDGVTTFAVPDLRGKTPVGLNALDSDFTKINNIGGEKTHQLTVSEMPKHSHDGKASVHDVDSSDSQGYPKSNYHNSFRTSDRAQTYSTKAGAISTTGGNTDHNNMQPYIVVNFAIKFEKTYFMNYSPQYAGFDTKTLFEGTANTSGDYVLNDDINNYQFLYVYGDINNGSDKSMTVIDVSAISPTEALSYFQYVNGYYNIRFTIGGKKLTYIDSTIGSAWTSYNARISKIVGVKSGSMNVEDFNITDAETDSGVADIWNEVGM